MKATQALCGFCVAYHQLRRNEPGLIQGQRRPVGRDVN